MDPISENLVGVVAILSVFVLGPISIGVARYMWRRSSQPPPVQSGRDEETLRRIADLQNSMDAMTLEIERIAENQRFLTKVLSDGKEEAGRRKELKA